MGLIVSEKKIFKFLLLYVYGHGQFGPQGRGWQNLCRGPLSLRPNLDLLRYSVLFTVESLSLLYLLCIS